MDRNRIMQFLAAHRGYHLQLCPMAQKCSIMKIPVRMLPTMENFTSSLLPMILRSTLIFPEFTLA